MIEMMKKTMLATVGAAYMTKGKIEEIGKKFIKEARISEAEGKKFIDELLHKSEDARRHVEKIVGDQVATVMKKLDIPSRKEVDALKKKVAGLEEQIQGKK
jgi:polyhydroxyalkanoate synthesis regulator phasin